MYYHIDSLDAIPVAFADCLGGLLSVVAQNLVLTLTAHKGHSIEEVRTVYAKTDKEPNEVVEVRIGDIYSEEQKDILVTVHLPKAMAASPQPSTILEIELHYHNVLFQKQEFQRVFAMVVRDVTAVVDPSEEIDQHKNRILCADAMEEAVRFGKDGRYGDATESLQRAKQHIEESRSRKSPFCTEYASLFKLSSAHSSRLVAQLSTGQELIANRQLRPLASTTAHQNSSGNNLYSGYLMSSVVRSSSHFANLPSHPLSSHRQQRSTHTSPSYQTSAKMTSMRSTSKH